MSPGKTILVTGAAGSVGHFHVKHLQGSGATVVATDRPNAPLPEAGKNLTLRPADLTDPQAPAGLLEGVDQVVHTAALIDIGLPFEKLEAVNVTATKALYAEARRRGVKTFLFFSSGSIYQKGSGGSLGEETPLAPGNDYERTKHLGEEYLLEQARSGGPAVLIVRPSLIYGPRGKMLGAVLACVPPLMREYLHTTIGFSGGPRSNWVHAEDVARAVIHLLSHGKTGQAYNVADDDPVPFGEVVTVAVEAFGLKPAACIPYPPLPLMKQVVPPLQRAPYLFEVVNKVAATLWQRVCAKHSLERELNPKLDREALAYAYQDTVFANDKLKATGFTFTYPSIRVGFTPTLQWYQQHRWVPTY